MLFVVRNECRSLRSAGQPASLPETGVRHSSLPVAIDGAGTGRRAGAMTASEEVASEKRQEHHAGVRRLHQGPVMPIGGAEDKGADNSADILRRFMKLAGGK